MIGPVAGFCCTTNRKMTQWRQVIRNWGYLVVPGGAVTGYLLHSYHENRMEQELYEEALFQKMLEERKRKEAMESQGKSA
jgi:hypothetical protein